MTAAEFLASIDAILDAPDADPQWADAVRRGMAEGKREREEMHPLTHDLAEADETVPTDGPGYPISETEE